MRSDKNTRHRIQFSLILVLQCQFRSHELKNDSFGFQDVQTAAVVKQTIPGFGYQSFMMTEKDT